MAVYSIRELEQLSGIKAHTIRIWEKRYNLIDPHRTNTNIRYYTDEDLKKILNVAVLNRQGIKISNIAKLNDLELKEEIVRVSSINHSHENLIDSLVISMIDLDEYKTEALIDKAIQKLGLRDTIIEVVYPFLEKVGILWLSSEINPAQEHFITFLIRQKVIAATEALPKTYNPNAKKYMMLLPEGEYHEIPLLVGHYLVREANQDALYLGQSVPYSDVLAVGAAKDFDFIIVSSIVSQPNFDFLLYLKDLGGAFPDKKIIYFSGYLPEQPDGLGDNHVRMHNMKELQNFIKTYQ